MKKVIGILALLVFAGNIASAELLKNMKYNGSIEIKNATGQKSVVGTKADWSNTFSRFTLGTNFDLNDDINAQVTAVKGDFRKYGTGAQNVDAITASVIFSEAYVNLKNVLYVNHKIGRQYYGKPGDIVIYYGPGFGANNGVANFSVSAIDGWYGEWMKNKWTVTGLAGKVNELSTTNPQDINLYGVTGKYAHSDEIMASAYVYQQDSRNDLVAPAYQHNTLDVAGAKVEGKFEGIGYGVEYAMNFGKDKQLATPADYVGTALKVNLDYALDAKEFGKFDFMGEYAAGSGDETGSTDENGEFQSIANNYQPGMIFGTYGVGQTMNGIGNLTTMNVGVKYMPKQIEKLTVGAKYFIFNPTEEPTAYDTYGSELDLHAKWMHSENVGLKASYAMFMPEKDFAGKDTTETLMGFDVMLKF
jgi:hypothetical protein